MTNNGRQGTRKPETPVAGEGARGRRAEGGRTKGVRVVPLWEGLRTGVRG
ncbi:hypothetical protein OG601_21870 [Streptomyces sp. NBC_01239]|nr:hypothetical protein [Streptomyces sp. NBC_01239]MCX4813243.1 hypothetical protein [Streptomyces sp. NBC_01239]